ncbi:uncharacterized protein FYW47_000209 [Aplochiton taeniatus]
MEVVERLAQTEQLVTQLKELIREKDVVLNTKEDQLKVEKEACETRLSKMRLQNKAKVTSLTAQLEELKKLQASSPDTPTHSRKGGAEGGEQASRGKIILLKKKVEELEQQLSSIDQELGGKVRELEAQRQRGEEMDAMLAEKDRKLSEKEAYIVHLQTALAGDQLVTPLPAATPPEHKPSDESAALQELQMLVQNLTRKVGEGEERYSLLLEQTDSLKELLLTEKNQYEEKEKMYERNIQTFKDIILQKDNMLIEVNQMHEQELFKLAAKSDASADLEQLLKALKRKLHEKEEVLLGKTQVIDVLQGEVDAGDQQIKELMERAKRLHVERESMQSKLEAEKHVMRAQLRDLMEKHQAELQQTAQQQQAQLAQSEQALLGQLEELRRTPAAPNGAPAASANRPEAGSRDTPTDPAAEQRIAELEALGKQKTDEANKSESKFLKMKAWSKTRIRQLEDELRKSQAGGTAPDLAALRSRITDLEEEREETQWKLEQYEELKASNELLEAKLVMYEEQQRKMQADLEQVTKRAASQASESGSADDTQSQVLEWQEMVSEAVTARDRAREEKATMVLRISHMEEEREALASRQQELEEELDQARGLGPIRPKKLLGGPAQRSLQEDFEFDAQQSFQDPRSGSESTTPMEGENMGGWWPEYSTPGTDGLRSVVEELELERNQLQEQILGLEERCQDLEDRLQLQARIESLQVTFDVDEEGQPYWVPQNESERLQSQLASLRSQQTRDAEKHQLLVASLNEQLKGLSDTQECLETSLIEKENTLAKTSERLELIDTLRESLEEKETQHKDVYEKLLHTEHNLTEVSKKCNAFEKRCSEMNATVADLTQKLSVLREKTQKQEVTIETLQRDLDQTNDELDKLNTTHLQERAQLIHDLQSCEREIDSLKDTLMDKEKEIAVISGNMAEYAEQITLLKQEIKHKEEELVRVESALSKAERETQIIRDSQDSDQHALNDKMGELVEKISDAESELNKAKEERDAKVEDLTKQIKEDNRTIQGLRGEIQKGNVTHSNHLSECETQISLLKEQVASSSQRLQESEGLISQLKNNNLTNEKLREQLNEKEQLYEKELKTFKEERNGLLADVAKQNNDIQALSKKLQEQVENYDEVKKLMQDKLETITSLEEKLKATREESEGMREKSSKELQLRDSEKEKLVKEIQGKSEIMLKLKNLTKSLKSEKQELQTNLEGLTKELDLQKQQVNKLGEKVSASLEINTSIETQMNSLTKDNTRLHLEIDEKVDQLKCNLDEKNLIVANLELEIKNQQIEQTQLNEALSQLKEQEATLKSELMEKNGMVKNKEEECKELRNEIVQQKDTLSKLQEDADSLRQESSILRQQLEEKVERVQKVTQECQSYKDELDKRNESIMTLSSQLSVMNENAATLESESNTLRQETEKRQADVVNLHSHIQALTAQNHQLRAAYEVREKDLAQQIQVASELDKKVNMVLEHNSNLNSQLNSLTEDHQKLQQELAQKVESVSDLTLQRSLLQEKMSGLEMQHSENRNIIEGLLKDKGELSVTAEELTKVLEQNKRSVSESLLEKTNECSNLAKTLREREEEVAGVREQVDSLKAQVAQLNSSMTENEGIVRDKISQMEAQQTQLVQLQETLSLLQEQGVALKSGLMEKDTMLQQKSGECSSLQNEVMQQKDLILKFQTETESIRTECAQLRQQLEGKDQALTLQTQEYQNHKDELNKQNESVLSLSSQLSATNENTAKMEVEISALKTSLEKHAEENHKLTQDVEQKQAKVVDLGNNIKVLKGHNVRLKTELKTSKTEASRTLEEMTVLRSEVSKTESQLSTLTEQLKTACSEKESLGLTLQQRADSLRQQEMFIKQLQSKSTEVEGQTSQKTQVITELQTQVQSLQKALQNKEVLMHKTDKELNLLKEKFTSDFSNLQTQLMSKAETVTLLQSEVNIAADSISQLRQQVDSLTSESSMLKETFKEREDSLVESQQTCLAINEDLTYKLKAKESEFDTVKEQLSDLQGSISNLNNSLNAKTAEITSLKEAWEERGAAVLSQTVAIQDLQTRADEAALFKTQFMESAELVSQLQGQIQALMSESLNHSMSAEETQSAFTNLQEKYAAHLEGLQDIRKQLVQRSEEVSGLNEALSNSNHAVQTADATVEALKRETLSLQKELQQHTELNTILKNEKEEVLANHHARTTSMTVEIERLKSQQLEVALRVSELTENLEQREMALHAINSQYTAQVKQAEHFVSEMQNLEEQNKRLKQDNMQLIQEHQQHLDAATSEKVHLQQEVQRLNTQKEDILRGHSHQIQTIQEQLDLQKQQQSSSQREVMEKMTAEKESLQVEVSVKGEEITRLKAHIEKIEQVLQDSEKEWLSVLDRETQHKNLLVEQLGSVENEIRSKDFKVNALKEDLDRLQEKLSEASSAIRQGSDQLKAKELEASASRVQLEKILLSVQEKDKENIDLRQTLQNLESEFTKLNASKECSDKDLSVLSLTMSERLVALEEEKASLQSQIEQINESYKSEMNSLRGELYKVSEQLKNTQCALNENEKSCQGESSQIVLLQEEVKTLSEQHQIYSEKVTKAAQKQSSLENEIQAKEEQANCMAIQISQQKELLAGLSLQLRDKDASVAQIIESASTERIKHTEERNTLVAQLESLEKAHSSLTKQLERVSEQLEESKAHLKENEDLKALLAKSSKERDTFKKKLQAALVVRKELLKKVEEYEIQKELSVNNGAEFSALQDELENITSQFQSTSKEHQDNIAQLDQKILEKDEELLELTKLLSEKGGLLEDFKLKVQTLQTSLSEKELFLTETLHTVNEKSNAIVQLNSSMSEREVAFECEKQDMRVKLEGLQNEMRSREDALKQEICGISATAVDVESELSKVTKEKAIQQKKAQAALLARRETMKKSEENEKRFLQELSELRTDYEALLEQHCQQTNELNAVQLKYDHKVKEFEGISQSSLSNIGELDTLRQLVEEKDGILQDLKMSVAETESQENSLAYYQTEVKTLQSKLEFMSAEVASKEQTLIVLEQQSQVLNDHIQLVEAKLEKANVEKQEIMEKQERYKIEFEMAELCFQREKQILVDDNLALQKQLNMSLYTAEELKQALEALQGDKDHQYETWTVEKSALVEEKRLIKGELDNALASIAQQSYELTSTQNASSEKERQLNKKNENLSKELERVQSLCVQFQAERESHKLQMESREKEKEHASVFVEQLKDEVARLNAQIKEAGKLNDELPQNKPGADEKHPEPEELIEREEFESLGTVSKELEHELKEREDALLLSQALITEKEELIAALEQQLQRQIHMHEVAMEKMRTEVDGLQQKSREDGTTTDQEQDNQSKIALLTRKFQAALVSRKTVMKENCSLKEQVEKLSIEITDKDTAFSAQETFVSKLKQQKEDLENSVLCLSKEKDTLITEVNHILNDNHNLSAACESLKLTIENITQQKQAFSCQLESLKDSQTDEWSDWKAKHYELKMEYESLLQAYENVSSEMDKMRQPLEVARRERQEALLKVHKFETERETLVKQVEKREEENEMFKEKMHKFAEAKQDKIQELEEENLKMKKDLFEFDDKQKATVEELTCTNQSLEAENLRLKESSEDLHKQLKEIQLDNSKLAEELHDASCSLEKCHLELKSSESYLQLKLDDAININNLQISQIEAQKSELRAQQEMNEFVHKENENLSDKIKQMHSDHELQLGEKVHAIKELQEMINNHIQEAISLNEKVRILEDDKSLLQDELENVQEMSEKIKNENEYLETVILKTSERIDELAESVNVLKVQNSDLSSQLASSKEEKARVSKEKEEQQLKLVREFEDKLKMVQRGSEGSKNVKKELEELLRDKHHEINQLQQDSFRYQELILNLERSLKASQVAREKLETELKESADRIWVAEEKSSPLEVELSAHKSLLSEARENVASVCSEKDQLAAELSKKDKQWRNEAVERNKALQNLAEQQKSVFMDREIIFQSHIDELQRSKEQEAQLVANLRRQVDTQDLQLNMLKREADTNLAKLTALSSTPQGAEATKQWDDLFQNSLLEKDSQLLEQGFVITRFLEDMRAKEKEVAELRVTKSRLERGLSEYSVAATAQQRQLFVMGASNTELTQTVEFMNGQLEELSAEVERLGQDRNTLNRQLSDRIEAVSQMQLRLQQLETTHADTEARLVLSQSEYDTLCIDLEKQEAISLQLKSLLHNKDAEISSLLSSREGQMSGYLEQLQANHRAQISDYEDRLTGLYYEREKADKEFRRLQNMVRMLQTKVDGSVQEKEQMTARMETFRNSMVSLQTERERLMSEYNVLQARSQAGLEGKDASIEGDLYATKGLKHEIKTLLNQMDDLNSENAMLRAQLVRYREDLNQVLSLKDSQLKELLKKQQEAVRNVEKRRATIEKQHMESLSELRIKEEERRALTEEESKLQTQVTELKADILALKKERAETDKGRVIADLQDAVAAKAVECNDLQQKVSAQKVSVDDLKDQLQQLEAETDKSLNEAEEKCNGELAALEREVDLMRSERETADRRVAELAGDLLENEQRLSEATERTNKTKAQNEALAKAMAALQNDRDQLIENFKILRNRHDDELRETRAAMNKAERRLGDSASELASLAKERDILAHKTSALEGRNADAALAKLADELSKALSEKEGQLTRVAVENDAYSRQVSAFSRAMASLQDDRDRLMDELAGARRVVESSQGSGVPVAAVGSVNTGESSSRKGSADNSSTQTDRLALRQKVDELQLALQQSQAYRLQTENEIKGYQDELAELRSERNELLTECHALKEHHGVEQRIDVHPAKETVALLGHSASEAQLSQLQTERIQLHRDLQRCLYEIQQRDLHCQQVNAKLQQVVEEKGGVSAQLRAVSQTLRDTQLNLGQMQNRCYWLESQAQAPPNHGQVLQGAVSTEVAPGAPQERSTAIIHMDTIEPSEHTLRLAEVEQRVLQLTENLAEEKARREAAEEALGLAEMRVQSVESSPSRSRDFSIQLETDDEWEALILNPNEPLLTRKVKGGVLACRRWIRGRSLYCSKMLTSRARSRYLFMAYLLALHVVVLLCLNGAL